MDTFSGPSRLVLLDRDGVVVVNRSTNIKRPADIALIPRVAEAIARLNAAGRRVAICTNQPEVARGAMSRAELDEVHDALRRMLAEQGARVPGMLKEALRRFGARAGATPFVGDQADDLKAAFRAGCPRVLVRTGLGRAALEEGLPDYVQPVLIVDDLYDAAERILQDTLLPSSATAA
jgi:D-glycero-D-manno-heptose 1,7-bisphosphate phosphatase